MGTHGRLSGAARHARVEVGEGEAARVAGRSGGERTRRGRARRGTHEAVRLFVY